MLLNFGSAVKRTIRVLLRSVPRKTIADRSDMGAVTPNPCYIDEFRPLIERSPKKGQVYFLLFGPPYIRTAAVIILISRT